MRASSTAMRTISAWHAVCWPQSAVSMRSRLEVQGMEGEKITLQDVFLF
jgi:hypothetical protein